jgi:rhamnose utilization protein RhaD (predicted bifunctional aldolase and dehydrogenase)
MLILLVCCAIVDAGICTYTRKYEARFGTCESSRGKTTVLFDVKPTVCLVLVCPAL